MVVVGFVVGLLLVVGLEVVVCLVGRVREVVLLLILFNANPPELWFWLVVLLVVLLYRVERWWSSRPSA